MDNEHEENEMYSINRSIINESALAVIVMEKYRFNAGVEVVFWRTGIAGNDTYIIRTSEKKYMMKIYYVKTDRAQIEASIEIMIIMKKRGINVPEVIIAKDNSSFIHIDFPEGERIGVLFEYIDGTEPDITNEHDSMKIGEMLYQIYSEMDSINKEMPLRVIGKDYLVQNAIDQLYEYIPTEKEKIDYLRKSGDEIWDYISGSIEKTKQTYGLCHGDFHCGNMKKDKNGAIYIFDFDACGYGYRIFDIGVYANINWKPTTISELDNDNKVFDMFSKGYSYCRGISETEKMCFHSILGLRHLELLGMVLRNCTVFEGIHWIEENLRNTYNWFMEWNEIRLRA